MILKFTKTFYYLRGKQKQVRIKNVVIAFAPRITIFVLSVRYFFSLGFPGDVPGKKQSLRPNELYKIYKSGNGIKH